MNAKRSNGRFLVVMAKEPVAGRVKTRLARDIGTVAATRFARVNTERLLRRVAGDPRWRTMLSVAPDEAVGSRFWPAEIPRLEQGSGDLGIRMQRIFDHLPPGPVVIVGTDIPGIRRRHIVRAFDLLGAKDVVFGPASDGGYWLVGCRRFPRVLSPFEGVRWSSPHALADTLANLAGRDVGCVETLDDVDEIVAYRAWRSHEG